MTDSHEETIPPHDETQEDEGRTPYYMDGISTVLGLAVFFLATTLLVAIAYILWSGLFSPAAPRTVQERQLAVLRNVVEEGQPTEYAYHDYVMALIDAEQLLQAQDVMDRALIAHPDAPKVLLASARLRWAQGDAEGALETVVQTREAVMSVREQRMLELAESGVRGDIAPPYENTLMDAYILEALIHFEAEEYETAIAAYSSALEEVPVAMDVVILRGQTYLITGENDKAAEDFRRALEFDPTSERALTGLEQAEGGE